MTRRRFAEGTTVEVAKSRADLEKLVEKHGATKFLSFFEAERAVIAFAMSGHLVRFTIALPSRTEKRITQDARSPWRTAPIDAQKKRYDAESRRIWRALLLVIRAKLEAAESEITTFEHEFMPFIVLADGRTLGEAILPHLDRVSGAVDVTRLLEAPAE